MPQSVDNGVVTGGQQGRRPPTLSPPSSHNLHLSLTRSSHFTHNDSSRLIFDALCLHPLRHTTCCLKERINFLNLFNFFLPCHFPGSSFQYTENSNCSQEGDYGRQKSPHYHQIIQTDLSLCNQNYHKNQNVVKSTSKYDIVDTQPPAWGLCCQSC